MRGKNQALANARRLTEAQEKVAALASQLDAERKASHAEITRLRGEIQNLRGAYIARVRDASASAIAEANDRADLGVRAVHEAARRRMEETLRFIFAESDFAMSGSDSAKWVELAELAGLGPGELLGLNPNVNLGRNVRRVTAKRARALDDLRRQAGA